MYKIKKGDIVCRISYGKDILFTVENIVKRADGKKIAILKGIILRIEADADVEDLELVGKDQIQNKIRSLESRLEDKVKRNEKICKNKKKPEKRVFFTRSEENNNGNILHLDGDKRYTEKSIKYYKKLGLNAIVRNVPENKQEYVVMDLLNKYSPDILVITGHDRNDKKWNSL